MTTIEQHKLVAALRDAESRMTREEQEIYTMLRKRDTDDEDLDTLSKKKLQELYDTYVRRPAPKENPLDRLFRRNDD